MSFLGNKNTINKIFFSTFIENVSVLTITFLSSILFLSFVLFYVNLVFIQFSLFEIIKVFSLFLIIFLGLAITFNPWMLKEKIKINIINLFWSFVVIIFLICVLFSPNDAFYVYFRTFPLLDVETGYGWHPDSAFHVSIINSFINFNYPSIGQHDAPIIFYHVLSHFIDSLIVSISGVDAWDSYGLFYFFKSTFLLLSILILIATVCKNTNLFIFILSIIILTPIIVSTWYAVASHGLWFASYIIILSSAFIFNIINKKEFLFKDFFILVLLLILISLGKVSSGFSYALLIGFLLLLKNYNNYRVYLFGIAMILFFYLYGSLFTLSRSKLIFSGFDTIVSILTLRTDIFYNQLGQIYIISFLTFFIGWLLNSQISKSISLAGLFSCVVLSIMISIQPNINITDIWYFIYGLSIVLLIYSYITIINDINRSKDSLNQFQKLCPIIIIIIIILLSYLSTTKFNLFNINSDSLKYIIYNINNHHFLNLDEKIGLEEKISLKKQISFNHIEKLPLDNRPLVNLKLNLYEFMYINNLKKKNTLLYIPKEIFENDFNQFKGLEWARGMMVYAITGVPLIHGIHSLRDTYGYAGYDVTSTWVNRDLFNIAEACKFNKNIVILENYINLKFSLIKCK
ncbi:hypothetical protein [Aliarcobacter butzleri]|uniref:hypothetical protein n=1 Tax=Aliarcobacter butzleri TaxID=28197 RepID=UPI00344F4C27